MAMQKELVHSHQQLEDLVNSVLIKYGLIWENRYKLPLSRTMKTRDVWDGKNGFLKIANVKQLCKCDKNFVNLEAFPQAVFNITEIMMKENGEVAFVEDAPYIVLNLLKSDDQTVSVYKENVIEKRKEKEKMRALFDTKYKKRLTLQCLGTNVREMGRELNRTKAFDGMAQELENEISKWKKKHLVME